MPSKVLKNEVKVWDIFIRVFHWGLVFLFIVAYLTGDDENIWHIYFGYAIGILISLRFLWGFIGSKYARFSNFVYSPSSVVAYIKSMLLLSPKRYLGHNPAGGYMVLALLLMLSITTFTGLKVYAVEGHGPLAGDINISLISTAVADDEDEDHSEGKESEEELWEEVHEASAKLTVILVFLHIFGVIVSGRLHNENLVKAMINGKKKKL